MNKTIAKMAEVPSRTLFTGEQVLDLLESDVEDYDGEMKCSSQEAMMSLDF